MWLSNQAVKVHMSYLELPITLNYLVQHQRTLLPSAVLEVHSQALHTHTHTHTHTHMKAPKPDSIMWHKQIIFLTSNNCNARKHLIQNCVSKWYADLVTDVSNTTILIDICWSSYCHTFGDTNNHIVTYSCLARQKENCSELLIRILLQPKDNIIHKTSLSMGIITVPNTINSLMITKQIDTPDNWCCSITCHLQHTTAAT